MEKKIQDFIHFYLGCEIALKTTYQPNTYTLGAVWDSGTVWLHKNGRIVPAEQFNMDYIMPILRPLSSMTGEETLTAFHMSYEDAGYKFETYSTENFGWRARNQNGMECYMPKNTFLPEVTRYLLSRGFDLFGLIDAGLAVDKNLPSQQ